MQNEKQNTARAEIKAVTNLGLVVNMLLFAGKLIVGIFSGSIAMIADAFHSLSDIATDLAVLFGVYIGSKEPDESHPYGHGRAETFSSAFIALLLGVGGAAMIYYAAGGISAGKIIQPHIGVFVVAVVSIVLKELLYHITRRAAKKSHSSALYANAWHHRSDAFSSIAVLIGFVALKFGFVYGDHIAAVAVGLMIILVGIRIVGDCLREFTEAAPDKETVEHIKNIINSDSSIRQWHKLRSRTVGREVFLDLHILVDPALNIAQAHQISENLENTMHSEISRPINITVHVEPDIDELRK